MSDATSDRNEPIAAALRESLARRDRVERAPLFSQSWPTPESRSAVRWRHRLAGATTLGLVGLLFWTGLQRQSDLSTANRIDPALAHQLSSTDYWRVPTDRLLAYASPPLNADLPVAGGLELSLEESLL